MTDFVQFPSAIGAVWSSGCPTIAPSGATFLSGSQWEAWDGALAMAVLKDMRVARARPRCGRHRGLELRRRSAGRDPPTERVQGPDGNLYITTDATGTNGQIWKVVPS